MGKSFLLKFFKLGLDNIFNIESFFFVKILKENEIGNLSIINHLKEII